MRVSAGVQIRLDRSFALRLTVCVAGGEIREPLHQDGAQDMRPVPQLLDYSA
jgi:hypothetical protein